MAKRFVDVVNEIKIFRGEFHLRPKSLHSFKPTKSLTWNRVRFDAANKAQVPPSRGVYAFVVRGPHTSLPPHGYVMYIGQVGHGNDTRTLFVRYGDYLREQKQNKRPSVHYMLTNWETCLDFCYAEVRDKRINLKKLKRALNDSLIPPFSTNDFSADIRQAKKAF